MSINILNLGRRWGSIFPRTRGSELVTWDTRGLSHESNNLGIWDRNCWTPPVSTLVSEPVTPLPPPGTARGHKTRHLPSPDPHSVTTGTVRRTRRPKRYFPSSLHPPPTSPTPESPLRSHVRTTGLSFPFLFLRTLRTLSDGRLRVKVPPN